MKARIDIPREAIAEFCRRWQVVEFALFGSVLREDFRPDSDIDVLVAFDAKTQWGFAQLADMRQELEGLLGRNVDLVEKRSVEQSENYIRRKHILTHVELVYVA
jgi:predicted nucleotidyltransferase